MTQTALTADSKMNTNKSPHTVCILTAGKGERLGKLSESLNKALLPINGKAIISNIIEKFPDDTRFVIGLGHNGDQVRYFLDLAHSDTDISYVTIDNYDGAGSGPGYSLLQCKSLLNNPFYFVSCDTLWTNDFDFSEINYSWLGYSTVPAEVADQYLTFTTDGNKVTGLNDKEPVSTPTAPAFVGLCYIHDLDAFWHGLSDPELKHNERQVSNGLSAIIHNDNTYTKEIDWIDVGNAELYKKAIVYFEKYDFSKEDESLYIYDDIVIKFFADNSISERRVSKANLHPEVFPRIQGASDGFYYYHFVEGKTLYQNNSPEIFRTLLEWLNASLWHRVDADRGTLATLCRSFYYDKTIARTARYKEKYPETEKLVINERAIDEVDTLLQRVPWEDLYEGAPAFIHGDLQFDNIIHADEGGFVLLDWRQDFGGTLEYGDIYYDFAKLYGGILVNYDLIKLNLLSYSETETTATFDFAQRHSQQQYISILEDFIESEGFSVKKVKLLVGLIFLNMSPLHEHPFDKLLHSLGRTFLNDEL